MNNINTYKIFFFLILTVCLISFSVQAQNRNELSWFLNQAEANSPLLNDYNNQIISKRIDSLKLQATYGFIVSGFANGGYSPTIRGWGYDNALTNGQSLFAGVRVSKEFITRNNLNLRLASYNAGIAQILSQRNISLQTLKKQITAQYIATYTSQQMLELSTEILHLLNQEDTVLKKLTESSVFKQTEYLTFKVTLQQNELAMQQQKADWQNNYALLYYLSGVVDNSFSPLAEPEISKNEMPFNFNESIYAKSFIADSLKIANETEIIKSEYKPKINAFSDGGYQSSFVQTPSKNMGLSVGIGISIPIYDGHQKKMLIQQNELALNSRQKYREQYQRQYQEQILQFINQINQYHKLLETANQQISYAKTLVEANAKQLPTGDVRVVDFILSINNLLSLKGNIIQYNSNLFNLQNQLQYLIIQ